MNKNIEIINDNLIAVKFSMIPWIKEIDYKPDGVIPAHEEFGRVTSDGVLLLNKDYPGFKIFKEWMPKLMKKNDKQLKKEIKAGKELNNKTDWQTAYSAMLQVEFERRLKEKAVI